MAKFEIYQDNGGQYRWRMRANNHQIIATGGQGYVKKSDCEHGVKLIKTLSPDAVVMDLTQPGKEEGTEIVLATPNKLEVRRGMRGIVFDGMPQEQSEMAVYLL